jgi:hypothetical protein
MNNFYLYRSANSDRFQFLPWDKDINFREVDLDVSASLEDNHLFATALQFDDLREEYVEAVRRCAAIAADVDASGRGWLEREVGRHASQIRAAAHADENKAYSNDRFEQEVAWMINFARQRSGQVQRQVR